MTLENSPSEPKRFSSEGLPAVQPDSIPRELLECPQWICWRYVDRQGAKKPDKQPVNPISLHNAGVHWANTWTTFEHAYSVYLIHKQSRLHGVGFVLTAQDPFVAIDIDNCLDGNAIFDDAEATIHSLQSYTEVSPSGMGLRILVNCPDFMDNARRTAVEVYSHSRFVTITGAHLEGTPDTITTVQASHLRALTSLSQGNASANAQVVSRQGLTDGIHDVEWAYIFQHDRYGTQHLRRFQGDTSLDGGDHSLTVIRLLNCLARWTGCDASRIRAMMLTSPLANEKWLSKRGNGDWLDYQIADAIRYTSRR